MRYPIYSFKGKRERYWPFFDFGRLSENAKPVYMGNIAFESHKLGHRAVLCCISAGTHKKVCTSPVSGSRARRVSFGVSNTVCGTPAVLNDSVM